MGQIDVGGKPVGAEREGMAIFTLPCSTCYH